MNPWLFADLQAGSRPSWVPILPHVLSSVNISERRGQSSLPAVKSLHCAGNLGTAPVTKRVSWNSSRERSPELTSASPLRNHGLEELRFISVHQLHTC